MEPHESTLQERLARLEAGEPLESCLDGLPPDQADLLTLAWDLRAAALPGFSPETAAAQRETLIRMAQERLSMEPQQLPRRRWLPGWTVPAGALAMIIVALCGIAALAAAGVIAWRLNPDRVPLAGRPGREPAVPGGSIAVQTPDPQTAVVAELSGVAEVQTNTGSWETVTAGQELSAGLRLRTGTLSRAVLAFHDGSLAYLGPNAELTLDVVDARTDGPRVIELTQVSGHTDHDVAHSDAEGSRYVVNTPSGSGTAMGTFFSVTISPTLLVRFTVTEGAIEVTQLEVTVIVVAGQTTTVRPTRGPHPPNFLLSGEGEVSATGAVWVIGGQPFLTDDSTLIIGSPQVGDWVYVEGRILSDGTQFADLIVLLHHAEDSPFVLTGEVTAIGAPDAGGISEWTVDAQAIVVDAETIVPAGIAVGDLVMVSGVVTGDGDLLADSIIPLPASRYPFAFTGVVEVIGVEVWTVSGIDVDVDEESVISSGIAVGDAVRVEGWTLDDGSWLARSIEPADEAERGFAFVGDVETIDPWRVSGVELDTGDHTIVEDGIEVGDRVRVTGVMQDDGAWLASTITLFEFSTERRFTISGGVISTNPWVIGGAEIDTDDQTEIDEGIIVGDTALAYGTVGQDGAWLAERIALLSHDEGVGCMAFTAVVASVDDRVIILHTGLTVTLDEDDELPEEAGVASVIIVTLCSGEDGTLDIVAIIVIFQLDEVPVVDDPDGGALGGVTVCHIPSGNPAAAHTITISPAALDTHLRHGDTRGACP